LSSNPDIKKPVIIIHSSLKKEGIYPSSYHVISKNEKEYTIGVEVIYDFAKPKIQLDSGDSICNRNHAQNPGTICCALKKGDKNYLLTCSHVLTGGSADIEEPTNNGWFINPTADDTLSSDDNFDPIGTWRFGLIDEEFDIALVETNNDLNSIFKPSDKVSYDNTLNGLEIFVNGKINRISGYIAGQIKELTEFEYNGSSHRLKNLILISANKYGTPSCATEGGDSGSLVYFPTNNIALGMVVGANAHYSYAIPMNRILDKTQTQLVK
jgi:V8-like Glu-specific endopeptidase